jgi:2'-5' RNA ligase
MHLTLDFLGETADPELGALRRRLECAARATSSFPLSIAGVGAFGRPPRVLYAHVGGEVRALSALRQRLEVRDLRPYTPHLTLGRVRAGYALRLPALEVQSVTWCASHVTLFRSTLTPSGPRYTALYTAALGGASV